MAKLLGEHWRGMDAERFAPSRTPSVLPERSSWSRGGARMSGEVGGGRFPRPLIRLLRFQTSSSTSLVLGCMNITLKARPRRDESGCIIVKHLWSNLWPAATKARDRCRVQQAFSGEGNFPVTRKLFENTKIKKSSGFSIMTSSFW